MKISRRKILWMIATALLTGCSSSVVAQPLAEQACPVPGVDGAPFEAPFSALQASFRCFPATGASGKPTVLLVHGTSLDSENNFSWNYIPALTLDALDNPGSDRPTEEPQLKCYVSSGAKS